MLHVYGFFSLHFSCLSIQFAFPATLPSLRPVQNAGPVKELVIIMYYFFSAGDSYILLIHAFSAHIERNILRLGRCLI